MLLKGMRLIAPRNGTMMALHFGGAWLIGTRQRPIAVPYPIRAISVIRAIRGKQFSATRNSKRET